MLCAMTRRRIGEFLWRSVTLALLVLAVRLAAAQDPPVSPTPTPEKAPRLSVDRQTLRIGCPPQQVPRDNETCDDNFHINVNFDVANSQASTFNYTISGGRILGGGSSVIWDLTGVAAGTYTVTIQASPWPDISTWTETATVKVESCKCKSACDCPAISVNSADEIRQGEKAAFTANVSGGSLQPAGLNWTVKNGKVTTGQGTPSVEVTPDPTAREVTATLNIKWDPDDPCTGNCLQSHSQTIKVRQVIEGRVESVPEGDTLVIVDAEQRKFTVRLAGIDAPELRQAFGEQSRQNLSKMVHGQTVRAEVSSIGTSRVLGKVLFQARDVNLTQLEAGLAWYYDRSPQGLKPADVETYKTAESAARSSRSNIWSEPDPVPPWRFRPNPGKN